MTAQQTTDLLMLIHFLTTKQQVEAMQSFLTDMGDTVSPAVWVALGEKAKAVDGAQPSQFLHLSPHYNMFMDRF